MSNFERVALKTNVRAYAYKKPLLLSAIGSFIYVWYEGLSIKFLKSFSLCIDQTIIGIKFESDDSNSLLINNDKKSFNLLIYSTRFIVSCTIDLKFTNEDEIECDFIQHHKTNLIYWIIDCFYLNGWAYILNARNEVIIFDVNNKKICFRIFGPQKCILYSGKFLQITSSGLAVASGTVFQKIILWAFEFDLTILDTFKSNLNDIQLLSGHDGVIFSIDYNPTSNILVSASDDRTVRIWNGKHQFVTISQKSKFDIEFWKSNNFELGHIYYGHIARIWKVCLLNKYSMAVSVGEDSNIIIWSAKQPYTMIEKKSLFKNNKIWSLEIINDTMVCGGSDGSIKFLEIEDVLSLKKYKLLTKKYEILNPKSVFYLKYKSDLHNIVSLSTKGMSYLIYDENKFKETLLSSSEKDMNLCLSTIFDDYIVADYNPERTKLVIASKYGHIGLVNMTCDNLQLQSLTQFFNQKIFDISFVNSEKFIVCLAGGSINMFTINESTIEIILDKQFCLPYSRHQWSSCGLLIEKNFLIVGDYSGNVFAFSSSKPSFEFRNVHGRNCVTCLKRKPQSLLVYSSGRNGKIIEYLITKDNSTNAIISLVKLRTYVCFPEMEWIAGFEFSTKKETLINYVYGFESTNFLVWDMNRHEIIFEKDCGGGHRSWDLVFEHNSEGQTKLKFCYLKKNNLVTLSRQIYVKWAKNALTFSSLPRKINCSSILFNLADIVYFLIAGEDNFIHVIRFNKKQNNYNLHMTLYGHISNITSIKSIEKRENESSVFYSISIGGRCQMILWKFWLSKDGNLFCQEKVCHFFGLFGHKSEHEVRIANNNNNSLPNVDIRYLNVDFIFVSENLFHFSEPVIHKTPCLYLAILVACSDSTFRLFFYDESINGIELIEKMTISNACVLCAKLIPFDSFAKEAICALTSTDGLLHLGLLANGNQVNLSIPDNRPSVHHLTSFQLHKSGINSIDYKYVNGLLALVTGGDDNCIKLSLATHVFSEDKGVQFKIIRTVENASVHTCQITGLQFDKADGVLSASIDQKLVCWKFNILEHCGGEPVPNDSLVPIDLKLEPTKCFMSSIADISSLNVIKYEIDRENLCLLCGEGFELVRL